MENTETTALALSKNRISANRRNAQKSTGPKTPRGKSVAKRNATSHGLLSKEIFLANENNEATRAEYEELLRNLRESFNPIGQIEHMLVERMAVAWWRLGRVLRFELRETQRAITTSVSTLPIDAHDCGTSQDILDHIRRDPEAMAAKLDDAAEVILLSKSDIQKRGSLSPAEIERLRRVPGDIYQRCRAHHPDDMPAVFIDLYEQGDPRNDISIQGEAMLKELRKDEVWLEHWKRVCSEVQRHPKLRAVITRSDIPDHQAAERILRYETAIERQFYRAMDQLERLQRRRQGDLVPAPVNARIALDQ